MPDTYRIQVKLGDAEFSAEGPEGLVKEAFEQFLKAREAAPPTQVTPPKSVTVSDAHESGKAPPGGSDLSTELLARVFQQDGEVVSLRVLPRRDNNPSWQADAIILLLYGFKRLANTSDVIVTKLNQGLKKSGVNLDRVDRILEVHSGLFMKGGIKSGGRYTLNNQGVTTAERWLTEQFN